MGSFHSVTTPEQSRYTPILSKDEANSHCIVCRTVYVAGSPDTQIHYPAVLCGLWLNNKDRETSWDDHTAPTACLYESIPPNSIHATRLPERVIPPPKSSKIVAALLRHTDFTKPERSALKRGFFSTLDVFGAPLGDATQLEGCHIHGCLFVEHGSLVFQATDHSRLPLLLVGSNASDACIVGSKHSGFNLNYAPHKRITSEGERNAYMDSRTQSVYQKASSRLFSVLRNTYGLPLKHKYFCRHCRLLNTAGLATMRWKTERGLSSRHRMTDTTSVTSPRCTSGDNASPPPPPLRLSWPLFTLRRFGFYGNSLFKLEAGRRAPRGEGNYLFVVDGLRGFRRHFEKYVHRRKSVSPRTSPQLQMTRRLPLASARNHPDCRSPPRLCQSAFFNSSFPEVRELLAPILYSHSESTHVLKKKSNSLSGPTVTYHTKCLQQSRFSVRQSHPQGLQSSCPLLSSDLGSPINADDIAALPDAPPPPPPPHTISSPSASPYDNIAMLLAHRPSNRVSPSSPVDTLQWVNSTHHSGRPYASRRAMTALVCSNQCARNVDRGVHELVLPNGRRALCHECHVNAHVRRSKTDAEDVRPTVHLPDPLPPIGASPSKQSAVSHAKPSTSLDLEESQSVNSPYYNLNSPEALFHLGRTKSLTYYGSTSGEHPSSVKRRSNITLSSSPASWNSTMRNQTRFASQSGRSVCPRSANTSLDSGRDSTIPVTDVHQRDTAPLHYATLDFDNHDLTERSPHAFHCVGTHQCTSENGSTANCPVHAYGTLISSSALGLHQRSVSGSGPSTDSHPAEGDPDVPTNYVAICQLQTLAMRAVLNATT